MTSDSNYDICINVQGRRDLLRLPVGRLLLLIEYFRKSRSRHIKQLGKILLGKVHLVHPECNPIMRENIPRYNW